MDNYWKRKARIQKDVMNAFEQKNKLLDRDLRHLKAENEALNQSWDDLNEENKELHAARKQLIEAAGLATEERIVTHEDLLAWVRERAAQPASLELEFDHVDPKMFKFFFPPQERPSALTVPEYLWDHEERLQRLEDKLSALEENE